MILFYCRDVLSGAPGPWRRSLVEAVGAGVMARVCAASPRRCQCRAASFVQLCSLAAIGVFRIVNSVDYIFCGLASWVLTAILGNCFCDHSLEPVAMQTAAFGSRNISPPSLRFSQTATLTRRPGLARMICTSYLLSDS